jgi:hypothetical protein
LCSSSSSKALSVAQSTAVQSSPVQCSAAQWCLRAAIVHGSKTTKSILLSDQYPVVQRKKERKEIRYLSTYLPTYLPTILTPSKLGLKYRYIYFVALKIKIKVFFVGLNYFFNNYFFSKFFFLGSLKKWGWLLRSPDSRDSRD